MPVVSRFFGIVVTMYYNDHDPPHFHAWYQGAEGTVEILTGEVRGSLPHRAISLLQEWRIGPLPELMANCERARERRPLEPIPPLE